MILPPKQRNVETGLTDPGSGQPVLVLVAQELQWELGASSVATLSFSAERSRLFHQVVGERRC